MKITSLLLFFASFAAGGRHQQQYSFPDSWFLGRGYDMVRANPRPITQPLDLGFASVIFDLSNASVQIIGDKSYFVPNFTQATVCDVCQLNPKTSVISGAKSFRESLNAQVRMEAAWHPEENYFNGLVAFYSHRASEGYLKTMKSVAQDSFHRQVVVDSSISCFQFCSELDYSFLQLDKTFVFDVQRLPSNLSQDNADDFFNIFLRKFGTHVVTSIKSGSLLWQRAIFSEDNFTSLLQRLNKGGIEQAAASSILNFTTAWSELDPRRLEKMSQFRNEAAVLSLYSNGRRFNSTDKADPSLEDGNPYPLQISMIPIFALLTSDYFPDDETIETKRKGLVKVMENGAYCSYLASVNVYSDLGDVFCEYETPDTKYQPSLNVRSNFGGTYYKSIDSNVTDIPNQISGAFACPVGYERIRVGGCGIDRVGQGQNCNAWTYKNSHCIPDNYHLCGLVDAAGKLRVDPQDSFGGFQSELSCSSSSPSTSWCPNYLDNFQMNSSSADRYQKLLVGGKCTEKIYVLYKWTPGAFIGGFYTLDRSTKSIVTNNPATGVASCPLGYRPHLLFQQLQKHSCCNENLGMLESFVCLMNSF